MTGKIKKGITSYIGKHIKILTDDWEGEFTKGTSTKSSQTFMISLVL